ncbi:MAG TPA: aldehyde dehydrogenase family protein [Oculatellaceae cyanobacterium]|jgi:acyl-CoA reductase-like NAD-dependent aldehyde dehydrogenase
MREYQLWIDGQFIPAADGSTFESLNPFNGQPVARVPRGKQADIDKAVAAARQAFDEGPWPTMSGTERSRILKDIADRIEAATPQLLELMIEESGSTYRKAKGEVWLSAKNMTYFAKLADRDWMEPIPDLSKPGVSQNWIVREPIGVCGQIIPWNFPLQMAIWKLGPALAAGNTIVLKPAEETPAVCLELAKILAESELPPGVVNIVSGYGEEAGAALANHPDVDKIAFTGSTEIGKRLMEEAGRDLKRITLELGGKSANIVFDDADLDMAIDGALYAVYYHSGQCCTAGTRLLLQEGIYDRFIKALVEKAQRIKLGNPQNKDTEMGPLISKKQQERVLRYIELGKKEGATCLIGGGAPEKDELKPGCFVEPTIFVDVDNRMTIAQEEIFGPVLSVIKFSTEEEAVKIANDTQYGLAGAVWSRNNDKALRVARKLRAGTVWINEYHMVSEKAPFGGYKQSGLGRELGAHSLDEYTEVKHIHVDEVGERSKKFWYDSVVSPAPQAAG